MPHSGGVSASSASAIRLLVVGSDPVNAMPAALRIRLRPPSHPTRYCARSDWPSTERDVDAGIVLCEARNLNAAIDRHRQFADPPGEDALDMVLPQPEPVRVPGRKVADVQPIPREPGNLRLLPLREEPISNSTLIEDLDGARVQAARARAGELLVRAPLDNGNIDPGQRQLARQHQAGRTSSGDHHRMFTHRYFLHVVTPKFRLRVAVLREEPGLEASPLCATY